MRRSPARGALRAGIGLHIALALLCASAAAAGEMAPPNHAFASANPSRVEITRCKGRFCTPGGCAGAPASPWSTAAGFGTAVLAARWVARRQSNRLD